MKPKLCEFSKNVAQSDACRLGLKNIGVGLAGLWLAVLLAVPATAGPPALGPLIELSRPNAVGSCDSGFVSLPGNWTLDDALEPVVAVNPVNPNNFVAVWIQG